METLSYKGEDPTGASEPLLFWEVELMETLSAIADGVHSTSVNMPLLFWEVELMETWGIPIAI